MVQYLTFIPYKITLENRGSVDYFINNHHVKHDGCHMIMFIVNN